MSEELSLCGLNKALAYYEERAGHLQEINAKLRSDLESARGALKNTGYEKNGAMCWCAGWASMPCIDQPKCRDARAVLAPPKETDCGT